MIETLIKFLRGLGEGKLMCSVFGGGHSAETLKNDVFSIEKHRTRAALERTSLQASIKHYVNLLQPLNYSTKLAPSWQRRPVQTYNKELRRLIQRASVVAQLSHHRRTPPLSTRAGSADGLMFQDVGWISQRFFTAHRSCFYYDM